MEHQGTEHAQYPCLEEQQNQKYYHIYLHKTVNSKVRSFSYLSCFGPVPPGPEALKCFQLQSMFHNLSHFRLHCKTGMAFLS